MSQSLGLTDDLVSAADAAFQAHPEVLAAFLSAVSAVFVEGCSLVCSVSPHFADLYG